MVYFEDGIPTIFEDEDDEGKKDEVNYDIHKERLWARRNRQFLSYVKKSGVGKKPLFLTKSN